MLTRARHAATGIKSRSRAPRIVEELLSMIILLRGNVIIVEGPKKSSGNYRGIVGNRSTKNSTIASIDNISTLPHWRQTTAIERTPARAWRKTTGKTLWTGTPRLAGVTIYNSNSDCEWRRRTLTQDRSFKQSLDSTRWAESEVNEDEQEREAISNVDNDNALELRATSDNRTEQRFRTAGVSEQSFNCMFLAMVVFLRHW